MKLTEKNLLQCPFCGHSSPQILPDEFVTAYWNIQCSNDRCGAMVADVCKTHVVKLWNRRAT